MKTFHHFHSPMVEREAFHFSVGMFLMQSVVKNGRTPRTSSILFPFFFEKMPFPLFGVSWDHQCNGEERI